MSIASEISRIQTAKSAIKTSIENKGVTVPSGTLIDGYASLINSIPTGSSIEYPEGIESITFQNNGMPETIVYSGKTSSGSLVVPGYLYYNNGNSITIGPKNFIITSGVTKVESFAFYYLESLENFSASTNSNLSEIAEYAFAKSTNVNNFVLPESVTTIGWSAFSNCYGLKNFNIPSGVTEINENTFMRTGLSEITIPNNVTSIANGAFSYCNSLTDVTVENGLTTIGDSFHECNKLSNFTINAVTPPTFNGSEYIFKSSPAISIFVPSASVNAYKAASGWSDYSDFIFPIGTTPSYTSGVKAYLRKSNNGLIEAETIACDATSALTDSDFENINLNDYKLFIIGDCTTTIADNLFSWNGSLGPLYYYDMIFELSTSITTIGNNCFTEDYNNIIKNIYLPNIETIGSGSFTSFYSYEGKIELGENLISIGSGSFTSFYSNDVYFVIRAITPPTIGTNVFSGKYIYVPDESVNDYKSSWTDYSNNIYPISDIES